jgi:hypothetical protein
MRTGFVSGGSFARGTPARQLIELLAKEGALNKQGKPIDKGYLYRVLNNRVYVGKAMHKGTEHPDEHDAIIEQNLWDQVHELISESSRKRSTRPKGRTPAILNVGWGHGRAGGAVRPYSPTPYRHRHSRELTMPCSRHWPGPIAGGG